MVKNSPCNAGDAGSIPGEGIKIPSAVWQLNLHATTREPMRPDTAKYIYILKKKKRSPNPCRKPDIWESSLTMKNLRLDQCTVPGDCVLTGA